MTMIVNVPENVNQLTRSFAQTSFASKMNGMNGSKVLTAMSIVCQILTPNTRLKDLEPQTPPKHVKICDCMNS